MLVKVRVWERRVKGLQGLQWQNLGRMEGGRSGERRGQHRMMEMREPERTRGACVGGITKGKKR